MTATKVLATAILTIYVAQIALVGAGMLELAAAVIADVIVAAFVLVYARVHRLGLPRLGVRRAGPVYLVAGVLVGMSAWYLNLRLVLLIDPPGSSKGLQAVVEQTSLVTTLIAIAVLPALVEELVFRGIFVRALATRLAPAIAIGISAVVFSLYHVLPAQMVSTFGLGLALAYLTLRADSVLPAMIAHLLNNTIAIVVSRDEVPGLSAWMGEHPVVMLVASSVLLGGGLAFAARGSA